MMRSITIICAIALLVSGCAGMPQEKQDGVVTGAIAGTIIGGGIGCGAAAGAGDSSSSTAYAIGCPIGAVAGGIIGGIIGYKLAQVTPPPPPALAPAPIAAPAPPPPPPAERIVLRGVHFDFNKATIRPDAVPILDEAAEILGKHPNVAVDVNGYCDAVGSYAYNLNLSQRRAAAVASYLESKGIASDRLISHGYGKTDFVASNATAEGRAQNRRVELVPTSN
jgi:outer membrane protein OmpA-like peptidoglycan-associated protein